MRSKSSKVVGRKEKKTRSRRDTQIEMHAVDDQMNLPVGTEFDYIIKAKAEEIDNQKILNNQKMDDLVEKLGYMDYRDALACNKYIIEAKRSGDYHQVARARILETAFETMGRSKRAYFKK